MATPGPLVLGFDTSAAHCAAVLLSGGRVVAAAHEEMARGQAERLMPLIGEVLEAGGATPSDLDAIGVGTGPGNFTGIRISVAAARGLALALGIPAVGVTGFEARALGLAPGISVLIEAPRGQLHVQSFGPGAAGEARLMDRDDLASLGTEATGRWVGTSAADIAASLGGEAVEPRYPLAEAIARIAADRFGDPALPRPAPLYLRAADAAPSRDRAPVLLP